MDKKYIAVPGRLESVASDGQIAGASQVYDDDMQKSQAEVNASTAYLGEDDGEGIKQLKDAEGNNVNPATSTNAVKDAQGNLLSNTLTEVNNKVDALQKQDVVVVDTLPAVADADPKKIYRVVGTDSYTDHMLNAAGDDFKILATFSFPGIDNEPTAGSENLVKSEGVDKAIDGVVGTSDNYIAGNINSNGTIGNSTDAVVSPYILVNAGDVIEWHAGRKGVNARLAMYGNDFNSLTSSAYVIDNQPNPFRVITVGDSGQKYIRAAFALDSIDKAYIKINGKVVYAPKPASEGRIGKLLNTVSIIGNGNNGVYSNRIAGLIAGHTYRVYVKNPDIPMSNVTSTTSYFRLWARMYLNDVQVSGYPFSAYIGQTIKDYYDIVVPTEGKNYSMDIGMRANYGEEQILIIEDITTVGIIAKDKVENENPFTTISLIGDNNNNVYGFIPAVAGRVYKVSIKTLDIDMSGVTYSSGNYPRLQLCVTDGNSQNSNIIKSNNFVPVTIPLSEYYFIRVPEGNDNCYIRISMRATAGVYQVFRIEDVTVEAKNKLESLKRGQTVRLNRMELNMLFEEYESINNHYISYTYKGDISTSGAVNGLTYYKIPRNICGGISFRQYKTTATQGSLLVDENNKTILLMVNHTNMNGIDFLSPDIDGWSYMLYSAYQSFDYRENIYIVLNPFTDSVKQLQNEISPSITLNDSFDIESEHYLKTLTGTDGNGLRRSTAVGKNFYDVFPKFPSITGLIAFIVDCNGYDSIDAAGYHTSSDYCYGVVIDKNMNILDAYYNRTLDTMSIINNKLPHEAKYFIYLVHYSKVQLGQAYLKLNKDGIKEQVESNSTRITTLEENNGVSSATSVVTLNQGNIGEDGYPIVSDKHVYTSPIWGGHGIFITLLDGYEIHQAHLYNAKGNLVAYDYVPPKTVTSGPLSPIIGDGLRFFYSTDTIPSGYYLVFVFTKVAEDNLVDISKDEFIIDKFCYLDDVNLHKMEVNGAYYKYAQDRIKQLAWVRWIPQENMISTGANKDPYFFKKGRMRFGIPYSEASEYTKYVGQNVTPYTFLTAVHNKRSVMYTERIGSSPTSKYGISYHGLGGYAFNYYGTVCTGLTGFIPGWKNLYVSGKYPNKNNNGSVPNLTKVLNANAQNVLPLDFIWKEGHCIIIKDIILDDQGNRKFIVIAEQTTPSTCITAYTPEMFEKRLEVQECVVSRWSKWDGAPASEVTPYIQMNWMDYPRDIAYNDDVCTFLGDKPCIAVGDPMFLNMNRTRGYTTLIIQMLQNDEWVNVGNSIDISSLSADTLYPSDTEDWCTLDITENITIGGKYRAYLTGENGLQSKPTQWEAISIIMQLTEISGGFNIDFTSDGTPYLLRHERIDGMEIGNDHYEITDSDITAGTISKNWSKPGSSVAKSYIKFFVRGEYGTAVKRTLYKDE